MKLIRFLFGCLWGNHYRCVGKDDYVCLDCEQIIHSRDIINKIKNK
jgi:hypothetical protein